MANFPRVWATGIGDNVPITGSELTQLDENISKSPNFSEGSEHSPTSPVLLHGDAIQLDSDGAILVDGSIQYRSGAELQLQANSSAEVTDAEINLNSGGILTAKASSNVNLLSSAQFRAYAGSTCQFDGLATITNGATWDFADGAILRLLGASDYPVLATHEEYFAARGDVALENATSWHIIDGVSWSCDVNTQEYLYYRVPLPDHLTVNRVQVYWKGPSHGTWPPQNLTTFTIFDVSGSTGVRTQIAELADTNGQSTYENYHALTIDIGTPQTFGSGHFMMIRMRTESGTNAASGSLWVHAEFRAQFTSLRGQ